MIPVLRYILPNDSATQSRGTAHKVARDLLSLVQESRALKERLAQGEIAKATYDKEYMSLVKLHQGRAWLGVGFFSNPYSASNFFVRPFSDYMLFLRYVSIDGSKSVRLFDEGSSILGDVQSAEKFIYRENAGLNKGVGDLN